MSLLRRAAWVAITGGSIGVAASCVIDTDNLTIECWCGEQWSAQVAGARAYNAYGQPIEIFASQTSATTCMTMLEHMALDVADANDPLYMAVRLALESQAIANCESQGIEIFGNDLAYTDCATTGDGGGVTTNLVHLGACWHEEQWLWEQHPDGNCNLDGECGQYYDCDNDKIMRFGGADGSIYSGETEGDVEDDGLYWDCDEYAVGDGPDGITPR